MNLYLIGYRGSGKSTVAPLLARLLGIDFVDTDQSIVDTSGELIAEIFETRGESGFRILESAAIKKFPAEAKQVISLGGGAPTNDSNRKWMKQNGKTAWLTAPPEILWGRICSDANSKSTRPDLSDQGGLAEVRELLAVRETVYRECADYTIDVSEWPPEQVAAKIACWWNSVDKN